jgi:hypothetical protein
MPVVLFSLISIPLICLVSLSLMAMISTAKTKIKAEAEHHCLVPRKTLKGAETQPLLRIHPFISVYIVRVHLIYELLKPKFSRHSVIKDHSKESNAFVKSRNFSE